MSGQFEPAMANEVHEQIERENRYIVIKRSDLSEVRDDVRNQFLAALEPLNEHNIRIGQRCYVVVESDWPEYELVWAMIEARVNSKPATNHGELLTDEQLWNIRDHVAAHAVSREYDSKTICIKHGRAVEQAVIAALAACKAQTEQEQHAARYMWLRDVHGISLNGHDFISYGEIADCRIDDAKSRGEPC